VVVAKSILGKSLGTLALPLCGTQSSDVLAELADGCGIIQLVGLQTEAQLQEITLHLKFLVDDGLVTKRCQFTELH
jgi:hypothetical protein